MSDVSHYASGPDGQTIATLALAHELDLIVLRRRLRAVCDDLNFPNRDIARVPKPVAIDELAARLRTVAHRR